MVKRGRPEDDEMRFHVMPLYGNVGFSTFVHATRNKPIGVTPGIADLEVFAPAFGFRFVHEVKIDSFRQSHEQKRYQEACDACGIAYVLGDREAAEDFLVWFRLANFTARGRPGERVTLDVARTMERSALVFQWDKWSAADHAKAMRELRTAANVREFVASWNATPYAAAHNERWGWKPTRSAIRKLLR